MRVFSRTLLITVCLHLLDEGIGQPKACQQSTCLDCDGPIDVLQNCTIKDFNVTMCPSSTSVEKGMPVTVTCIHNVPNGSISWLNDDVLQQEENNKKTFHIKHIQKTSVISCNVSSMCGNFNSTITINVKDGNIMLTLLICVGVAAALLMLFAMVMKIKLKRGQAQSQARKRQRQQNLQNIHSTVNTVSSYY